MIKTIRTIGLFTGMVVGAAILLLPTPAGVADAQWFVIAVAALMVVWWVSEAIPLAATALVPIVLLPLLGVSPIDVVTASYAHPLIFLFLGGFVIAKALERWGLHQRLAGSLIRLGPKGPAGLVASLMAATAFLSMWISNTATAMVMFPIAQSIVHALRAGETGARSLSNLAAAMMLAIAFSATIGGMATLIGTPPNALLAGYLQNSHDIDVGFGAWMLLGVPVAAVLLPITWLLLIKMFPLGDVDLQAVERLKGHSARDAGKLPLGARLTALIASLAALMLVLRPALDGLVPGLHLSDAGIAMGAALILFAVPAGGNGRLIGWAQARSIRWDVLLLFGGGLALASAIDDSGLAATLGDRFASLKDLPLPVVILVTMAVIVLIGELASNTAMAAVFLPIAGAAAVGFGTAPIELVLPVGLAASLGFMLPVATPPNAIAYGTGEVTSQQMLKAGSVLDVIGVLAVYAIALLIGPWAFSG